jgi:transposase
MRGMNAYSEDLRKKVVEALGRGATKSEAARSFGVSRSSVKRYAKLAEEGDLEERPTATLRQRREFLRRACGVSVSESTVSRALKRLGWSRKKVAGSGGARRVPEGRLEGPGLRGD